MSVRVLSRGSSSKLRGGGENFGWIGSAQFGAVRFGVNERAARLDAASMARLGSRGRRGAARVRLGRSVRLVRLGPSIGACGLMIVAARQSCGRGRRMPIQPTFKVRQTGGDFSLDLGPRSLASYPA